MNFMDHFGLEPLLEKMEDKAYGQMNKTNTTSKYTFELST